MDGAEPKKAYITLVLSLPALVDFEANKDGEYQAVPFGADWFVEGTFADTPYDAIEALTFNLREIIPEQLQSVGMVEITGSQWRFEVE